MMCPETRSVAPYVLGALDPPEQVEMEWHLTSCEICRQELIEVAHLPGLMHRLSLDDVTQEAPVRNLEAESRPDLVPGSEVAGLLPEATTVEAVRRRPWSHVLVLAMIVVLVLATGGVASAELWTHQPSPGVATWTSTDAVGGIDTVARLADRSWGTDIRLWMEDLPPGLTCRLVVYPRTGGAETAGWWSTNYEAHLMITGSTSIPLSQLDRIDVIRSDKTLLATLTSTTR
ncbi:zf-HC2 domain-containing protein [Kribbella pittospori]|nr:zf-HC2 domain-containing protein [Kribbella pittospori]